MFQADLLEPFSRAMKKVADIGPCYDDTSSEGTGWLEKGDWIEDGD